MEKYAVIYTRVSDPSQVGNNSLDTQEDVCLRFAKNGGYTVVKKFSEEGVSAKTVNNRKALLEAIKYCSLKANKVSALIVYSISRFSRNTQDGLAVMSLLAKNGVQVVSATEPVDNNPIGKAMKTIFLSLAQLDNEIKGEVVKDNMQKSFRRGLWPFKPPIGYRRKFATKEENKGLPPIQDGNLAPLINSLFQEAAKGLKTKTQLVKYLNGIGFPEYYHREADIKIIDEILRKTFYYGYMYAKKWNEYAWGLHDPVVDELTWKKSYNAVFDKKRKYNYQDDEQYPLKGYFKCGECGGELTTAPSSGRNKIYYYYECRHCNKVRISRDLAHEMFNNKYLVWMRPNDRVMEMFNQLVFNKWDEGINEAKKQAKDREDRIVTLKKELTSIRKSRDEGIYTADEAKEEAEKVRQKILVLEVERSDIKCDQYDTEIVRTFTKRFLQNLPELWLHLDYAKRQSLLAKMFPKGFTCDRNQQFRTAELSPLFQLINDLKLQNGVIVTLVTRGLNRF